MVVKSEMMVSRTMSMGRLEVEGTSWSAVVVDCKAECSWAE